MIIGMPLVGSVQFTVRLRQRLGAVKLEPSMTSVQRIHAVSVCGRFLCDRTGASTLRQQDSDRCADRRDGQHREDGAEAPSQAQQSAADR